MSRDRPHVLIVVENNSVPQDRRVWNECRALVEAGIDVSVVCPRRSGERPYEEIDGAAVHRYDAPEGTGGRLAFVREFAVAWFRTWRLTRRVWSHSRFDVLQACNPPDRFVPIAAAYRLRGVPFVFDQHDLSPEMYVSRFGRGWGLAVAVLRWMEYLTYHLACQVITTNQWYRTVALLRGRLRPDRVSVARNGPDLDVLRPAAADPALRHGRDFLCLFVGMMEPHDGLDLALRAVAHVVHDLGRTDCHFAFVGDGESRLSLIALAQHLRVEDFVSFPGWAGDEALAGYLSTADLGLQPDPLDWRTDISTATKTVEYMGFGVPTVAFDLRETRATLGGAGAYATPNDPLRMGELVVELLDDPGRRDRMGAIGRRRVEQDLSWNVQKRRYVETYRTLLDGRAETARARAVTR